MGQPDSAASTLCCAVPPTVTGGTPGRDPDSAFVPFLGPDRPPLADASVLLTVVSGRIVHEHAPPGPGGPVSSCICGSLCAQ